MDIFTIEIGEIYTLADIPESHRDLLMSCHHSGACDSDVETARPSFAVSDHAKLSAYLKEFGAWNEAELRDKTANLDRLLWIMAADLQETGTAYTCL